MNFKCLKILVICLSLLVPYSAFAGHGGIDDTDSTTMQIVSFFDLRDRESFVQVTNVVNSAQVLHIQIFTVGSLCQENNFYDTYTGNDTHTYNLRDIQTNDGNPSGIVIEPDAYGVLIATVVEGVGGDSIGEEVLIGNLRILDVNGYEYRTNLQGHDPDAESNEPEYFFNYNEQAGIIFSDIVGIPLCDTGDGFIEVAFDDPVAEYALVDVDIFNLNEVVFSCRNVIFACITEDSPRFQELLEQAGDASVAAFEYGINDSITHSKGGELLCPNNVVSEGIVRLRDININTSTFMVFVGLNNGNNRGSMDAIWRDSTEVSD